nr:PKD domain-containing protein [Allomuricauda sp.]
MKTDVLRYFWLTLFVLFVGCTSGDDTAQRPTTTEESNRASFEAETESENGSEISSNTEPVTIMVGESVVFKNNSQIIITTSEVQDQGGTVPIDVKVNDYNGPLAWTFTGGSPATSTDETVTVTYNEPGKYAVRLQIDDGAEFPEVVEVADYVTVVSDEPETFCYVAAEEVDDGRSADFIYDDMDERLLQRVDKLLSDALQEYSTYEYNDDSQLQQEEFYTPANELLGKRILTYYSNKQLANQRLEDADANLVFEIGFDWDDTFSSQIPTGGSIVQPDGVGGTVTTDFEYVMDAEGNNVERVNFSQDGTGVGYRRYEHDLNAKIFTNLSFVESYPQAFNLNNILSETTYDADDNITSTNTFTYGYGNEDNCGQPISVQEDNNGAVTNKTITYKQVGN